MENPDQIPDYRNEIGQKRSKNRTPIETYSGQVTTMNGHQILVLKRVHRGCDVSAQATARKFATKTSKPRKSGMQDALDKVRQTPKGSWRPRRNPQQQVTTLRERSKSKKRMNNQKKKKKGRLHHPRSSKR